MFSYPGVLKVSPDWTPADFAFVRALALIIALLALTRAAAAAPELVEIPEGSTKLKSFVYRPSGDGPFPAVVALHGCAGLAGRSGPIAARYRDWGERLAADGFVVVFPDSFGSRGLPPSAASASAPYARRASAWRTRWRPGTGCKARSG